MITYGLAFTWGIVLLASFAGWGSVFQRILGLPRADVGLRIAYGMAALITLGGVFNYFQVISPALILTLTVLGLLGLLALRQRPGKLPAPPPGPKTWRDPVLVVLVTLGALVILFRYATYVHTPELSWHDDYHGYLNFPAKMLQTGGMGIDQFNTQRLISSLGGVMFLQCFVLAALEVGNTPLLDSAMGFVAFFLLLAGFCRQLGLSLRVTAAIVLTMALIPRYHVNVSAHMVSAVLFLALLRLVVVEEAGELFGVRRVVALAVVGGALCASKNTNVPAVVLFLGCLFGAFLFTAHRGASVRAALLTALLSVGVLLAWMLDLYRDGHTLLYPFLGTGLNLPSHVVDMNSFSIMGAWGVMCTLAFALLLVGFLLAFQLPVFRLPPNRLGTLPQGLFACLLSGAISVVAISLAGNANGAVGRYSFPYVVLGLVAILARLALGAAKGGSARGRGISAALGILMSSAIMVGGLAVTLRGEMLDTTLTNLRTGLKGKPMIAAEEVARLRAMQESTPRGEPLLVRMALPFVLDFSRQPVYVASLCSVSPDRAMPCTFDPEAFASYMLAHGVRYLAYDYACEANFPRAKFGNRLAGSDVALWDRDDAMRMFAFQDNTVALGLTRVHLFDDGRTFVLDLATRSGQGGGGR